MDSDAFEAIFVRHAPALRSFAQRRVAAEAVDDVVAEAFAALWRRRTDVPSGRERPWLFRAAANLIANQHRSRRRATALADRLESTTPAASPSPGWLDDGPALEDGELARALASLSDRDRECLLLVAWDGLSHAEAADVTGCSAPTFAVRLHRARRRLADALASPPPTPTGDPAEEVSRWTN